MINNDVDYCLKMWRRGLVNVFTPYAQLIHHELASRAAWPRTTTTRNFRTRGGTCFSTAIPISTRIFSRDHDDYSVELEPARVISPGYPIVRRECVRRILVVKLDHIGDCVLALPALRRLKRYFPAARLTILSAPSTRSIWTTEPAVTMIIEFEFFHARSALGTKEIHRS